VIVYVVQWWYRSALIFAAENKHTSIVKLLLDKGAGVDQWDRVSHWEVDMPLPLYHEGDRNVTECMYVNLV